MHIYLTLVDIYNIYIYMFVGSSHMPHHLNELAAVVPLN